MLPNNYLQNNSHFEVMSANAFNTGAKPSITKLAIQKVHSLVDFV
jgi:hypothetical protein